MIHAIARCRLFANPKLLPQRGRLYVSAFARCREPDGTVQVLRIWSATPRIREILMRLTAGADVVVGGTLVGKAVVPVGGAKRMPLLVMHAESVDTQPGAESNARPRSAVSQDAGGSPCLLMH